MTTATARPPARRRRQAFHRPRLSAGPHFAAFAEGMCRHTKGEWAGRPLTFEPWQSMIWNEALEIDPRTGRRIYNTFIQGRPRKNYKSTECSAVALYLAGPDGEPEADVYLGAASRDQADVVFSQAINMVRSTHSHLDELYEAMQRAIIYPSTNGSVRKISSEGFLAHGLNPHGVVLDELHAFRTEAHRELYRAMTTGHGLRRNPLITTITTAGYDKSTILGELYDASLKLSDVGRYGKSKCLLVARDPAARLFVVWYGAPEGADIENRQVWRECNPAQSVSMEFLEQQWRLAQTGAGGLTVNDFCRLHLNMWTASKERWIGDEDWGRTRSPAEIPRGGRIHVAVDASITYDTTAVAWSHQLEDGSCIERVHVWSTRADVAHDTFVPGGRIDLELVEEFVIGLARSYELDYMVYDPAFFEDTASRLSKAGLRVAPMKPGSIEMYEATQHFFQHVREGLVHTAQGPAGEVLMRHVQATAAVQTERGYKLSKLRSARPIDATVAVVMAHAQASGGAFSSVYEQRDLLVLGGAADKPTEDEDW